MIWTTFKFNVNCQVTSHYSIFKQLSASQLIVYQPRFNSLPNCGVRFNISQVWRLSNFVLNFFQTFLFQPRRSIEPNCGVRFNISQFWNLSNLISNFFEVFFAALPRNAFQRFAAWGLIYHKNLTCQILFEAFFDFFISSSLSSSCSICDRALNCHAF